MRDILDFLLANQLFLAPLLLVAAFLLFAILKRLLKLAVVIAIAGGLYLLLVRFYGIGP